MPVKHWIRIGVSMLFLAGAVFARADELDHGDAHFIDQAAQAGAFEIQASEWAVRNAENDEVKRYARTMIADHTGMADQLKGLAAAKGANLPADLSAAQTGAIKALQAETGARLDQDYADNVAIAAHKDAITLFVDAAERAKDPEVKAFAQQTLPALKAHLDAGMALRKSLAASGKASPEESPPATGEGAAGGAPGTVSPASRQAPPTLLPGDKGAPKP
jgi:putative membrane protein